MCTHHDVIAVGPVPTVASALRAHGFCPSMVLLSKVEGSWRSITCNAGAAFSACRGRGGHFSAGRAGIAAKKRYALGFLRQGFQRRPMPDAMPTRYHTRR
jgi:hypothetical protein